VTGRGAARTIAGLALAIAGLLIAFRRLDLDALGTALRAASWPWFLAAAAATVLAVVVRAWRWRLLLAPIDRVGFGALFSATMIGYFGNGVLPLRVGELMRAAAIGRRGGKVDPPTALGSIAVERLLDVVSALAVAAIVVPLSSEWRGRAGAWTVPVAVVLLAATGLWWASRSPRARAALGALAARGGRFGDLARSFLRGLLVLGEGPLILPILLQTIAIWLLYAANVWAAARAAAIPLDWLDTGLVLVATIVAVSVPAAPGYVGTFHAAVVLVAADLLGHSPASAQAFAILAHASSWLPTVAIGALCLVRSSMRLGEVTRVADSASGSGAETTTH
jgi:uncharacterized membrane protein YbhN (UPF0104 family)